MIKGANGKAPATLLTAHPALPLAERSNLNVPADQSPRNVMNAEPNERALITSGPRQSRALPPGRGEAILPRSPKQNVDTNHLPHPKRDAGWHTREHGWASQSWISLPLCLPSICTITTRFGLPAARSGIYTLPTRRRPSGSKPPAAVELMPVTRHSAEAFAATKPKLTLDEGLHDSSVDEMDHMYQRFLVTY